jgi:ornithine cyclodeaminase/alanine dehydrogenase-like protein (mu-crystallin family)
MKNINSFPRRRFLKQSVAATGFLLGAPTIIKAETLGNANKAGANSRIGIGFIGTGLIARGHLVSFSGMRDLQAVAACDVRASNLKNAVKTLVGKGAESVATSTDYKALLRNREVDIVCIATCCY